MGSRIFWATAVGFLVGIFIRSLVPLGWSFVALVALLGIATTLFALIEKKSLHHCIVVAVALFACALGIARMQSSIIVGDTNLTSRLGQSVTLAGIVVQEPDARDTSTLVSIPVAELRDASSTHAVRAGVLAKLPAHVHVSYGEKIVVTGELRLPQAFDTGAGRQFRYSEFLAAQGIAYQLEYAQIKGVEGNSGNPLKAFALDIKAKYLEGERSALPEPEAGLAGGITVGDKRSVGPELTADFQRDSLVHMVVLSGYNITVVINAIAWMLQKFSRTVQFGGSIFVVMFFILMSGGSSSAVRSSLMALVAVFARATHRVYLGERVLLFVACLMTAWNPWLLCFDPGFQLSALATLGLVLFTPIFTTFFKHVSEKFGLREILASTCATQLMVLPLLLYQNGTVSLVALPANILALIPVPWAMFFSFVAALGGMMLGPLAPIIAFPAYVLLWYIITIAHLLASLPFAALTLPAFSAWWVFVAYVCIALLYISKNKLEESAQTGESSF